MIDTELGNFSPEKTPRGIGVGAYISEKIQNLTLTLTLTLALIVGAYISEKIQKPLADLEREFAGMLYEATKWKGTSGTNQKDEVETITKIQAGFRGKLGRNKATQKKVQKTQYGYVEEQATLRIQAGARGRQGRKQARRVKSASGMRYGKQHEEAAIKLQAAQRGRKAKANFKDTKRVRKIALCGCPGGGKATQSVLIAERYGVIHISLAQLIRNQMKRGTEIGIKIVEAMDAGKPVNEQYLARMVRERLQEEDCQTKGWLLDGYPMNKIQAEMLVADNLYPEHFIVLDVDEETAIERCTNRRIDPVTNRIYHLMTNPPPIEEILVRCVQRPEDQEGSLLKRYSRYHEEIGGAIKVLDNACVQVDAATATKEVTSELFHIIDDGARQFILLGPPGAGKTTQANILSQTYGVEVINIPEIIAKEIASESRIGKRLASAAVTDEGISDKLLLEVAKKSLDTYSP